MTSVNLNRHFQRGGATTGASLHRYWLKVDSRDAYGLLGIGVTAFDRSDALKLVASIVYEKKEMPSVVDIIEDVDVSSLDKNHVQPNMFPPAFRGVWFPMIDLGTR